ncbi:MAG: hypothetical protein JWM55_438 [Acidimicrobiaceae bacterium]|nr:hypothetical protein [Acidimicrobiaceae bacterium]
MAVKKRVMAITIGVVALLLTVVGVVAAATDSNSPSVGKDPLALNGYPPKTADLVVTVSTGSNVQLNANVGLNFATGGASAVVHFPLVITTASVDVVAAKGHMYVRSADVSNGPWLSTHLSLPNLYGVSLELTKPDVELITGFHETVSKSGYSTTYHLSRDDVAFSHLFAGANARSTLGTIQWSITVGSQGELTQSTVVEQTKKSTVKVSVSVLSYNQPVRVAIPSARNREPLSGSGFAKLLSSVNFSSLLIPSGLASFSQSSLT